MQAIVRKAAAQPNVDNDWGKCAVKAVMQEGASIDFAVEEKSAT